MSVMSECLTADDYIAFLTRLYGFEAPVEIALLLTPELDGWIDLRGRTHGRLLRADLAALGILETLHLPRCAGIGPFDGVAGALGWLYVVERNTLVHGLIERQLRQRLPALKGASSYLVAQSRSTGARLRELGDAMDRCARHLREADKIVQTARVAFRCQHRWFQRIPDLRVA